MSRPVEAGLAPSAGPAPRTILNPVIKDAVTFLELAAETGGQQTRLRIDLAPGGGNEAHYHRQFDETFTCEAGTLGLQVGGRTMRLRPGERATAKAGEVHRFFNPSPDERVTFQVQITPGAPGFERMLQVAYGLAADGRTNARGVPVNPFHTALLVTWGDTNMPGWLSLAEPVLRWLARHAERKGVAATLAARYARY